ncbi:hypothetical protein FQZ97_585680 [compost metagenome]
MTRPAFPAEELSIGVDSSTYTVEQENPALTFEIEGGYTVSRPRHTRRPRKTYAFSMVFLTDEDRVIIQDFWDLVRGGSDIFDWVDPATGNTVAVRFKGQDPLPWKYTGSGLTKRWEVNFKLEQA